MEGISAGEEKQSDLIESFCAVTSCAPSAAQFFLESHNWELDAAVQSFFDAEEPDFAAESAAPRRRRRIEERAEGEDEADEDYLPSEEDLADSGDRREVVRMDSSSGTGRSSKPSGSRPARGIRTLADLNRRPEAGSDSDDSDGPQEYYTGGEKSGMLVQDPSKPNPNIEAIFEQARQMGAGQGSTEYQPPSASRSFTGTGRLLSGESVQVAPPLPESVLHEVVFWADGFTVDGGPLRRFEDPSNEDFLESIKKSECPRELEPADRRTSVHVSLSRREQKCPVQEPVKRFNPFAGVGRTLSTAAVASSSAPPTAAPTPAPGLTVDESRPVTTIQLRLADGTRMVARFNHDHTVGDIRAFIDAARPSAERGYRLQTMGFPPSQLTDPSQTIQQAGLASSVIIQKF